MTLALKILPLSLHLLVGFHLHVGLAPLKAVLLIARYEVVEEQGVGALRTILGQDAHKQQVYNVCFMTLQGTQDVYPSKWEEATLAALLQSACKRRQRYAHTYELVVGCVPVLDKRHEA